MFGVKMFDEKMSGSGRRLAIGFAAIAACGAYLLSGQQTQTGPYIAAQAAAGRTTYQSSCAGCHGADLNGQGSASPLTGGLFMGTWGDKTAGDLIGFLQGAMPPTNPGSLGEQNYINVVAFLLDYNSARPGNDALTANTKITIRSVATGQPRQVAQAGRGGRGGQAGRGGANQGGNQPLGGRAEAPIPATPRGLTVPGEVKTPYATVTDAMMRNPDPGDWLMLRHDYHANNYSTLNQITAGNV